MMVGGRTRRKRQLMSCTAKRTILRLSKWSGLFRLARYCTRRGLRILCYHGFALADESVFRPPLFMLPATFRKRLEMISEKGFPVLELEEALHRLGRGDLPAGATVITVDDGFYSVYQCAFRLLQEFSFPATVYVTTYYAEKGSPVFRLVVQYMFWKTNQQQLDLGRLGVPSGGLVSLQEEEKDRAMWEIIRHGETQCDEPQRCALARALGEHLQVDYASLAQGRFFSLLSPSEIREMAAAGIDIQLHTHRHRLPLEEALACREITGNRAALEPLVGKPLQHFCYPSGFWSDKHWPWLAALGIKSAAASDLGLNDSGTPPFALKRFLDGEHVSAIEFEAELCGFGELARSVRSFFGRPAPVQYAAD